MDCVCAQILICLLWSPPRITKEEESTTDDVRREGNGVAISFSASLYLENSASAKSQKNRRVSWMYVHPRDGAAFHVGAGMMRLLAMESKA